MTRTRRTPRGDGRGAKRTGLVVECDRCSIRGVGCGDCAIGAIIGKSRPGESRPRVTHNGAELTADEWRALTGEDRRALSVLAEAGLLAELLDAPGAGNPAAGAHSANGEALGATGLTGAEGKARQAARRSLGLPPHARAS